MGPSIVGSGAYRYRYRDASSHEGETCRVGFSPRRAGLGNLIADLAGLDSRVPLVAAVFPVTALPAVNIVEAGDRFHSG